MVGVNIEVTYIEFIRPTLLHQLLLDIKYLPDGPRDHPALTLVLLDAGTSLHGVGLAAASLSVREHADVVSVQGRLEDRIIQRRGERSSPD